MNVLEINNLQIDFHLHTGPVPVIKDISFSIPCGKTVALVGESGSGKSVTAQAIMRILPPMARISGGRVVLKDPVANTETDIAALNANSAAMRNIRGGRISMIFQEPMVSLSPLHTIGNQVTESILLHQEIGRADAAKKALDILGAAGFPDPDRAQGAYPFELSGGLRQRAMIASALACEPVLLIADEPTTALDVTIQAQILKLIKELQQQFHMAVLLITHDLGVVANMADEVVVMYYGEIVESGGVRDIFSDPQHPYLNALMKAVPHFGMKPGERLVPVREVRFAFSRPLREQKEISARPVSAVHLSVRGLTRTFQTRNQPLFGKKQNRSVRAVDDVSFDVMRGECFGLVGESGCGKTTLSKILMRALSPDSGDMTYYDGSEKMNIGALNDEALFRFRRRFQLVFQDPFSSLNPRLTAYDIIREPLVVHNVGDKRYQTRRVKALMGMVGLDSRFANRYPHSFSGGQRQRIGIARALALQPEFIICDEPVSALDVSVQAQVLNLLKDLRSEFNLTYIFISHNLAVVNYICDRIAVMCRGQLVEIAPKTELFNNPAHPYTRALLSAAPFPDLEKPLDFAAVMDDKASDPGAWPPPYRQDSRNIAELVEIADQHYVQRSA